MTTWIMALADRTDPAFPTYAEDVNPVYARASVEVDDFAELLPVLLAWREHFGDDITAYALSFEQGHDWAQKWSCDGPPYRLDTMPGGWVQVRPDTDAKPNGRSPFSAAVEGV
ncbi:hypothetical protein ABWK57_13935 [Streptomyces sp. NPDC094045]|uniref:hypothetical protein n=1 Tax=unclassified Streptomyces TaxID=2593676 RepID=UPI0033931FCF